MADKKISDYTAQTTPDDLDLVEIEEVAVPATKKSTLAQIFTAGKSAASTSATGVVQLSTVAEVTTGTSTTLVPSVAALKGIVQKMRGTISNPQAVYAQRAQIPLFRADAALTITRINVTNSVSDHEIAGDLKWADDIFTGGFANAAVIDVCDTTSGVFTATTGFDDATVASGKEVYFQLDSSPHADVKDIRLEVYFTYD
jgi:hypothetical protein